jgi:hypothetical protein
MLTTTKLSKQDKDARKFIVRNVANDLFSLVQAPRSQWYGVIGVERRKAKNIYPWITDGMLDHQIRKLKKSQKKGVSIRELEANDAVEQHEEHKTVNDDAALRTTGGRPTGSTVDALKTLDSRKRKAFDDATNIYSKFKMKGKLPRGGLNRIIERSKVQNGLENEVDWTISAHTVRLRHKNC